MSSNKPWDRPWSMEEIIDNSDQWSLAGDVALLNTLKAFAENVISKSTEINNNLHNLTNNLEETSLQLNIAQNEFQSLRNSQFIESRVYEDDETLPQADNPEKAEEKAEPDHTEDIKVAALKGLEVIDRYFDKVEVSVSDSEDDDIDLPNYVLRPKDLYIDRPLPYVIGSEDWHKSWHVGLEVSSSDSETEKVSDKFSESDSETDLPIIQDRSQIKGTSDTSSELDFPQRNQNNIIKQDLFQSSDSDDQNSIQASATNRNFAEELAAKLGNVITQELAEPEINRRPIQTKSNYGDVFFDEPPPLDSNKGLFSGGKGLFDDDDDDEDEPPYSTPKEQFGESPKLAQNTGPSLFDGDNSDDEIFTTKKPTLQTNKAPLFAEEPPALDEKKKPIGGVSIFGGANFDKKLLKRQPSSDDEAMSEETRKEDATKKKTDLFGDDLFKTKEDASANKKINLFDSDEEAFKEEEKKFEEKPKEAKTISLFDDEDDLFKDDLFSSTTKKKFTSGLFDDVDNHNDDLFLGNSGKSNLFQNLDNENSINVDIKVETKEHSVAVVSSESDSLFGHLENSENEKPEAPKPKPRISLFDSPPPEPDDLFADEYPIKTETIKDRPPETTISDMFDAPVEHPPNTFNAASPPRTPTKKKTGIFDSSQSDDQDDLFGEKPPQPTPFTASTPNLRLFDPSPPPDDDWETKSDNSDEIASITDQEEIAPPKTNLFAEEPPSLDYNKDSPGKVSNITGRFEQEPTVEVKPKLSSPGKLKHNLNINVGALMPGRLPPKRGDAETIQKSGSLENAEDASLDTPDHAEVLHSVTKHRARVPLNRRPSTRRGRKAALKNSAPDFKLEHEEEESSKRGNVEEIREKEKAPPLLSQEDSHPVVIAESVPKNDLFDDADDEDDMFSSKKVTAQAVKTLKKSSLFDDDDNDDDDDIFKSFASARVVKKEESKVATEKKIPKVSSVKKLENTKPDDDPLSALLQ